MHNTKIYVYCKNSYVSLVFVCNFRSLLVVVVVVVEVV